MDVCVMSVTRTLSLYPSFAHTHHTHSLFQVDSPLVRDGGCLVASSVCVEADLATPWR